MTLAPGTKLGPYEILSPIGAGGMGEVYRAHDPRVGRDVAIKVSSEQFSDRFTREVHAVASLNHSNVCTLYDVGPNYLVMELVEGPTLADRIKQGPIPLEESLEIAKQIADALEAAHEKGIVHRDLKPGNIKLRPDGTVKVLDFGLAKVEETTAVSMETSPTLSVAQTAAGVLLGTAAYMSPEQARGKPVDKRADIWAFGVVLYEMLTGKQLFSGETVSDTLAATLKEDPDFEKVPVKIRPLLRSCLEKNPSRRLRDIGDAWRLLGSVPEPAPAKRLRLLRTWAAIATLLVIALAAGIILLVRNRMKQEEGRLMRLQLELPGIVSPLSAISPDGRHIAFIAAKDGKSLLYLRSLEALESHALQGTDGALFPFWSPDSRFIGFGAGGKVKKIGLSGGYPEILCDLPGNRQFRGGTWGRSDVIVFANAVGPLYRISATGGKPVAVTAIDESRKETTHRWPSFLPDGRHFLFFIRSLNPEYHGIYVGSLDSGERKRVASALSNALFAAPGFLLFARDNDLLAQHFDPNRMEVKGEPIVVVQQIAFYLGSPSAHFTVSETGVLVYRSGTGMDARPLIWVDRGGRKISDTGIFSSEAAISPDGKRIAASCVQTETGTTDIWLIDLSRGINGPLTRHAAWDLHPAWSPDGKQIVFASQREGPAKLFKMFADVPGSEERLLDSRTTNRPTDWSPDGRFIVYRNDDPSTNTDLWALPLFGDRSPFPIARSVFNEAEGRISPDGGWIAYSSDDSGRPEIYVQAFPTPRQRWPVTVNGGADPKWRGDGRELFYIAPDGKLMAIPVKLGEVPTFGAPLTLFDPKIWDPLNQENIHYGVSADGQRFVLPQPDESPSQLTVVLNWTSLLTK